MAGSKSSLVIDSPITRMQSTETTFAGISPIWIPRIGWLLTSTQLISIVNPSIFRITCNSIKL